MVEKVLIIGLGQIGHATAKYISKQGLYVDGFDVNRATTDKALQDGVIEQEARDFSGYDYYIICVSTHDKNDHSKPDTSAIENIARKIFKEGKGGSLVSIESTIPVGTCKAIHKILTNKFHLVHIPHRYYSAEKDIHGVNQLRVIGGMTDCCMEEAFRLYTHFLHIPMHQVSTPEIAELSKIAENTYRFMEIAFAEELKMVCDKLDMDFSELRKAVNTKWNVKVLEAKNGIIGHCLPKDLQMFLDMRVNTWGPCLAKTAKELDEIYRHYHMPRIER